MPVSAIAASPTASAVEPSRNAPPSGGFAAALDAVTARMDPARRPTVALGTMVAAYAGASPAQTLPPPPTAAALGGVRATPAASDGAAGAHILAAGERYLGVPYKWGGTNPDVGLDCSGFTQRTFADLGIQIPRVSVDQAKAGTAVAGLAQAKPGDLVFWKATGGRPNHIGIYAGDNKMLVAPRTGDVVKYQELSRTPDAIRRIA
ncbi:MAG: NlpC/P60 family protein [Egicoccus sp.]